jgi:hypothetical protein
MKKNIIIILLLLFINILNVSAITVARTSNKYDSYVNMTNNSNNILSEIIIIIPKEILSNVDTINALQFVCSKNSLNPPNQNLVFRFFKYYGYGIFSPIDNSYILPSQCIDFSYQIKWNLYNIETVDHNYDYAFGMYSNSVDNGSWEYIYLSEYANLSNPYDYSWLNISNNNPLSYNVSIVDINGNNFYDNGSKLRNNPYFKVYGTLISETPTPTPTPTPTETVIGDSKYGTSLNNSTNLNDLNNTVNNPNALNNISIGNTTVGSITTEISNLALPFTFLGFLIFCIRFLYMRGK